MFMCIHLFMHATYMNMYYSCRSSILGNKTRPMIVMGADVTHPAPRETEKPSIAAVSSVIYVHANVVGRLL